MTEEVEDVIEEAPETIETPEAPAREWSDDDAAEAEVWGWKSPDKWQGEKPEGYIDDPRRYVDRIKSSKTFKTLDEKMSQQQRDFEERTRKLEAMTQRTLEAEKARYQSELARLKAVQRRAVEEADTDAFDSAGKAMEGLKPPEIPKAEPVRPEDDPFVKEYVTKPESAWMQNPVIANAAYEIIERRPDIKSLGARAQLEFAEAEIRKMYPAYFPETAKPKPTVAKVDGGGLAPSLRKTGFEALPPEAKRQFKLDVQAGLYTDDDAGRKEWKDAYDGF